MGFLDYFVIYDEGVIEFSDSTTNNSGNNFSVSDMIDAGGFNGNDRIYKLINPWRELSSKYCRHRLLPKLNQQLRIHF